MELFQRKPLLTSTAPAFGRELPMGHAPPTPTHVNPFYFSQVSSKEEKKTHLLKCPKEIIKHPVIATAGLQSNGLMPWLAPGKAFSRNINIIIEKTILTVLLFTPWFRQKTVKFCFQTRRGRTSTDFVRNWWCGRAKVRSNGWEGLRHVSTSVLARAWKSYVGEKRLVAVREWLKVGLGLSTVGGVKKRIKRVNLTRVKLVQLVNGVYSCLLLSIKAPFHEALLGLPKPFFYLSPISSSSVRSV